MAPRVPKTPPPAVPKKSTGLIPWDEQLAKEAEAAAAAEAKGGASYVSLRGGILTYQGAAMPGNQMAVIVVDHIFENVFYEGKFDPQNPIPPTCFAFARTGEELAPHESVVAAGQGQAETCQGCPHNEFGSADTGKGKACRNSRRLALLPAGMLDAQGRFTADIENLGEAELALMKLPVTSIKGWAGYVQQLAATLRRPPHGMITKIKVVPDQKTQFRVIFEALEPVPNEVMEAVMAKRTEAQTIVEQPYSLEAKEQPAPPAKGARASTPGRQPARKAGKY